jgi:hypothetical protein
MPHPFVHLSTFVARFVARNMVGFSPSLARNAKRQSHFAHPLLWHMDVRHVTTTPSTKALLLRHLCFQLSATFHHCRQQVATTIFRRSPLLFLETPSIFHHAFLTPLAQNVGRHPACRYRDTFFSEVTKLASAASHRLCFCYRSCLKFLTVET